MDSSHTSSPERRPGYAVHGSVANGHEEAQYTTYHICKGRRRVRMIHGIVLIHDGLSKQPLRLCSILPMLHEEHVLSRTSQIESGQSVLISLSFKTETPRTYWL